MSRPTPRPWIDIEECVCEARTNEAIETSKANAAHIVKCVNLHDELVAMVRLLKKCLVINPTTVPIIQRANQLLAKTEER